MRTFLKWFIVAIGGYLGAYCVNGFLYQYPLLSAKNAFAAGVYTLIVLAVLYFMVFRKSRK
jgi:hypothetical protein